MKRTFALAIFLVLGLSIGGSASAAFNFYVELSVDGVPVDAEPTVFSMGPDDVSGRIEGYAYDHQITNNAGRLSHGEIRIIKRVDKSSPLLHDAMAGNKRIDAVFWFYRSNFDTGVTERVYSLTLTVGAITSIAPWLTTGVGGGSPTDPLLEAVTFSYTNLLFESETGGTSYEYIIR